MSTTHVLLSIGVMAVTTALLRFAPFLLFPKGRPIPAFVLYLGRTLPYASIGMLVVYCFRHVKLLAAPHALPEVLASALVLVSYRLRRSTLLSVLLGTGGYMLLLRLMV